MIQAHCQVLQPTPVAVIGTMDIAVGRVHKLALQPEHFGRVHDLASSDAEPLHRMLRILLD